MYDKWIDEAVELKLISKSYKNSAKYGFNFSGGYEQREPYLSIMNKITAEKIYGTYGHHYRIEREIAEALINEKRISHSAASSLLIFFAQKRQELINIDEDRKKRYSEKKQQEEVEFEKSRKQFIDSASGLVTHCPSCSSKVSGSAFTCPQCGHPLRYAATRSGFGCLGFTFLIIVVPILIIVLIF
jgi:hypothetical protein